MIIDPLLLPSISSNSTLTQHIQQLPFNNTNVDYVYSQLQSRRSPPLSNDDSSSKRKRSKRPATKNFLDRPLDFKQLAAPRVGGFIFLNSAS
ncbi:unnamed protein product [Rhizophagus irregularis]|nr:unnamed protein product [Rhizophagus irregularis]CAB5367085.1 unnamed protein product [Rhizophagus irregularis]